MNNSTQSVPVPVADLVKLATAQRILAMDGHDDITLGHMSLRDMAGRGVWIKKALRGIDEVFDESDFVLIDWNGKPLANDGPLHSEWPIHTQIMARRRDVNVVGHTHAKFAVLFSATDQELCALNHEGANLVDRVGRFTRTAGLINTVELGDELAGALADNPAALLKNHGIVFVGADIAEAALNGLFLERACRMQVTMASTGWKWSAPSGVDHDRKMGISTAAATGHQSVFFDYFERRLKRTEARDGGARKP